MAAENNKESVAIIQRTIASSTVNLARRLGIDVYDLTNAMKAEMTRQVNPDIVQESSNKAGRPPLNPHSERNQI